MSSNRNRKKPDHNVHAPSASRKPEHSATVSHSVQHRSAMGGSARWVVVGSLLVAAFFASFAYAQASRGAATASPQQIATDAYGRPLSNGQVVGDSIVPSQGASANSAGTAGGGCCGGSGGSAAVTKGSASVTGGVQKVTVDLTQGSYTPNQISAKAGVPIELVFKGPASGCNGYVQSQDLGFQQDVSNGGTIKVGALKPGTYTWACSMNMYRASIVVK
jgi:hypothetical protein